VLLGAVALLFCLGRATVDETPRPSAAIARSVRAVSPGSPALPVPGGRASGEASADSELSDAPERDARAETFRSTPARPDRRERVPERLARNLAPPAPLSTEPVPDRAAEILREPEAAETSVSPLALDAMMPLQAARESFLEGLAANQAASAAPGAPTAFLSNEARKESQSKRAARDFGAVAPWAALAGSGNILAGNAPESLDRAHPRLLDWKPAENSQRLRILRRVGAPGLSDNAHCRPQEPACPVARISSGKTFEASSGDAKSPAVSR